jgi:hypothetical protein
LLNTDSGTAGITALLIHLLIDTEWEGLIHVSVERSHESFKAQIISIMEPGHLGNLGVLGVPVLEIKELHSLYPRIGELIKKCDKGSPLIRKHLQIMAWTSCGAVHLGCILLTEAIIFF